MQMMKGTVHVHIGSKGRYTSPDGVEMTPIRDNVSFHRKRDSRLKAYGDKLMSHFPSVRHCFVSD